MADAYNNGTEAHALPDSNRLKPIGRPGKRRPMAESEEKIGQYDPGFTLHSFVSPRSAWEEHNMDTNGAICVAHSPTFMFYIDYVFSYSCGAAA